MGYIKFITLLKTHFKVSLLLFCFITILALKIEKILQFNPNNINSPPFFLLVLYINYENYQISKTIMGHYTYGLNNEEMSYLDTNTTSTSQ